MMDFFSKQGLVSDDFRVRKSNAKIDIVAKLDRAGVLSCEVGVLSFEFSLVVQILLEVTKLANKAAKANCPLL